MPTYDFECEKCNKIEEHFCKFDDVITCECGKEMKRLISTPAFMFKTHSGTDKGRIMQTSKNKRFRGK